MSVNYIRATTGIVAALSVAVSLSGCGVLADRSSDYMNAAAGEAITVPVPLSDKALRSKYRIPEIENARPLDAEFELPSPPDATAAIIANPYQVEQFGDENWLQLFQSPSDVWPLLELFWQQYSVDLAAKNTTEGFQVTVALADSLRNQTLINQLEATEYQPLVLKATAFQLKVVHGVRRNTSEVQVRALLPEKMQAVLADQPVQRALVNSEWQPDSLNPRLERALLEVLGKFVSSDAIASRHSFLANEIGGQARVRLERGAQGQALLNMDLNLARAQNELNQALRSSGVIVSERVRDSGEIYISYLSEEQADAWYFTEGMLSDRKLEKNIALRIREREAGGVVVEAEALNAEVDERTLKDLMALIYEHTS